MLSLLHSPPHWSEVFQLRFITLVPLNTSLAMFLQASTTPSPFSSRAMTGPTATRQLESYTHNCCLHPQQAFLFYAKPSYSNTLLSLPSRHQDTVNTLVRNTVLMLLEVCQTLGWHTCFVLLCFCFFFTSEYIATMGFHCIGTGWKSFPAWNSRTVMWIRKHHRSLHRHWVISKWEKFQFVIASFWKQGDAHFSFI